jgi:hypothetical protein
VKRILLSIALVIVFTSSAYGTVTVNLYDEDAKYGKTDPRTIKVFRRQPEGRELIKMGEIVVEEVKKWSDAEKQLRNKAGEIGADAVYVIDSLVDNIQFPANIITVTGIAVKYKDSAATKAAIPYLAPHNTPNTDRDEEEDGDDS